MNTPDPIITTDIRTIPASTICWKAVLAGTVAAIGMHILLATMGIGAGLSIFSPATDANPVARLNTGAAIIWSICALVSLFFGALLAGRFSPSWHTGFVHGILVWSLTLIITMILFFEGAGLVLGGGLKVLGEGLKIGSQTGVAALAGVGQDALKRGGDQLNSFVDEAEQSIPTNSQPKAAIRAKREIGFAVAKLFAPENEQDFTANRAETIKAVMEYTQMSSADATVTVDGWIASYKNLKTELAKLKTVAEEKARQGAEAAAKNLSCAAIWTFFGLLIGLLVSAFGGSCGSKYAAKKRGAIL